LEESAKVHLEFGNRHEYLFARVRLGYVALREGNLAEARQIFAETVQEFQKDKYIAGTVFALEGIASLYVIANKVDYTARLVGWADATREKIGDLRLRLEQEDINQVIYACLTKMGESEYEKAYEKGQTMSLDQAITYALES
jgi:rhamnogalacturonyl hydrolase YesR